jgi:hypothetical protein
MLDLTNEEEQREMNYGPVPSGSVVLVELEVVKTNNPAQENPNIAVAHSGLRQLPLQLTVCSGTYNGVKFRQHITMPVGCQKVQLTEGQRKACNIGGATLKAICVAARKPTKMQDVTSLNGLRIPVRVGINDRPYEKDGKVYWNNTLAFVVTPEKDHYANVFAGGEYITDGPVIGKGQAQSQNAGQYEDLGPAFPSENSTDQVPF